MLGKTTRAYSWRATILITLMNWISSQSNISNVQSYKNDHVVTIEIYHSPLNINVFIYLPSLSLFFFKNLTIDSYEIKIMIIIHNYHS